VSGVKKRATVAAIKPRYFASAQAFRSWLDRNHERAPELWGVPEESHRQAEQTQARRLAQLIAESAAGRRIGG